MILEKVLRWVLGVACLALIPFLLPIAAIVAIVYYIPVTIGGWVMCWVRKLGDE